MPVFTANVPGVLKVGDRIEIGGKIKENARKMSVNLCAQEGEEPKDVVLHFDVRFHRDNIISLSRKNGIWIGSGNYDTNYNMFVPGTIFRITFEVKAPDVITIYCQGKFHSNFLPKVPLTLAKYLVAWADVERVTHCYFHMGCKIASSGDEAVGPTVSPRLIPPADGKRNRSRKKTDRIGAEGEESTYDSSDEDIKHDPNMKRKSDESRADKYFYDTLMCQPPDNTKFGSPDRRERDPNIRTRPEYSRRYPESDTEKNDSENYSEESKNGTSVVDSEDILPELDLKKRVRRSKFPFAQVVNFMGKNSRRN